MKERPILFSGAMVRAILEGRKTQTRRSVKRVPAMGEPEEWCHRFSCGFDPICGNLENYCPYGYPGNRLWVRETWQAWTSTSTERNEWEICECPPFEMMERYGRPYITFASDQAQCPPWRPSIHMPRWASRITLEIVGVRVERLQDISEADAMAEGLYSNGFAAGVCHSHTQENCRRCGYKTLWNTINGAGAWDKNPWVWVIEFKRVEA